MPRLLASRQRSLGTTQLVRAPATCEQPERGRHRRWVCRDPARGELIGSTPDAASISLSHCGSAVKQPSPRGGWSSQRCVPSSRCCTYSPSDPPGHSPNQLRLHVLEPQQPGSEVTGVQARPGALLNYCLVELLAQLRDVGSTPTVCVGVARVSARPLASMPTSEANVSMATPAMARRGSAPVRRSAAPRPRRRPDRGRSVTFRRRRW